MPLACASARGPTPPAPPPHVTPQRRRPPPESPPPSSFQAITVANLFVIPHYSRCHSAPFALSFRSEAEESASVFPRSVENRTKCLRYDKNTVSSTHVTTPQASYDVTIGTGLLRTLYPRLRKLNAGPAPKTFVITSPEIWALWHKRFLASFPADAQPPAVLFLPAGERHKRLATVESLAQQLVLAGADRDSILLAFGGGVVGDVTGFLAAIYMRGIRYVGIPSTILAMVDSSLGGKTGVNLAAGKNLVGAFHHPLAVLSDIEILGTLPPAELRAGLQEAIKAGITRAPRLFTYMQKNAGAILSGDPAALTKVVHASVQVKADVVSQDEKESGLRMIRSEERRVGK